MIPGLHRVALLLALTATPAVERACDSGPAEPGMESDGLIVAADGTTVRAEVVAHNLEIPWSLTFAPDGRLFFTERPGRVRVIENGQLRPEPALVVDDVHDVGEAGLLGIALAPDFESSRHVFLLYTQRRDGAPPINRVLRYRELAGTLAEGVVIFDDIPGHDLHDGGRLRFGPDGRLYVTMGDAWSPDDAQDLASWSGKILRLNPDGTTPADNPRASPVFTHGHRNPQGLDWHPTTGELWATEHGPTGNDEVNRLAAGSNYGWPTIQGEATMTGLKTPLLVFTPSVAPSGASFYTGTSIPGFRHDLFFATLRGEHLHRVRFDPEDPTRILSHERLLEDRFGRLRDVVTGPDGALFISTSNRDGRTVPSADDDRIIRLIPAG